MLLKRELIQVKVPATDSTDALLRIARGFVDAGYAKPSFPQAVVERERVFPTGLPAAGIDIALPHSDSCHVNQTSIAIATLAEPVEFTMMGEVGVRLSVRAIFMLAIAEAKAQLEMLQRLMGLLQDHEMLTALCACMTPGEVYDLMAARIGE